MSDTIARPDAHDTTLADIAASGFLARYRGETLKLYTGDLCTFYAWCHDAGVHPLEVKRIHLEEFRRHLEQKNAPRSVRRRLQTIRSFYRVAVADELIDRDPTIMLRLPAPQPVKPQAWMDRWETQRFLAAAEDLSPAHHVLACLMIHLGMRVTAACNVQIEDFTPDRSGYLLLETVGKGGVRSWKPVPVPMLAAVEAARAGRDSGPLVQRRDGRQQDRNGAYAWVKIIARNAGLPDDLHPHSLRRSAITLLLDNGCSLSEAQDFADHASPGTTALYNGRTMTPGAHPAHVVARVLAA